MRSPAAAPLLALVLLVAAVPAGVALLPGADAFAFATDAYAVELEWSEGVRADGVVVSGTLHHANRTATFRQDLVVTEFTERTARPVPVAVVGAVTPGAAPVLTLRVSTWAPGTAEVAETTGEVRFTFTEDAILHAYEFHVPNAVAPSYVSTTTLAWSAPFTDVGSAHPDGSSVSDDGASLDGYGKWKEIETYGVFQHDASDVVGHARLDQGEMVNYLVEGLVRVKPLASTVRTAFTPLFDYPTIGLDQGLRATDAIVLGAAEPTPAAFSARIADLAARLRSAPGEAGDFKLFDPADVDVPTPTGFIPHVLVGVPDSGINPYHEIYHRPNLTVHPCTYIRDFPCEIPSLPLSVGVYDSYEEAYAADAALWDALEYGRWYWIPKTAFVAVMCEGSTSASQRLETSNKCLIDDTGDHGTGTTSSVLTENPNALLAFKEGNSATRVFEDGTLPIDILSYSWGAPVPLALPAVYSTDRDYDPFFVAASGNEGAFPVVLDSQKASHAIINVGGADAKTRSEPGYSSWKTMDYVSQYCRPTARAMSITGVDPGKCGTSFAAPTVAGVLSKVVLDLRRQSGYTGSVKNGMVDPVLGVSKWDVREALNATATYAPDSRFPAQGGVVPLAEDAPWYQWGWGYVDASIADATTACILDETTCPAKAPAVEAYMDALWRFRDAYGGWTVFDAHACTLRRDDDACRRMPSLA